jgi:hypothetical protein
MNTSSVVDNGVDKGVRILSLGMNLGFSQDTGDNTDGTNIDNGGPGTYSQLLVIKEYMVRLANDRGIDEGDIYPADYFDLMGGVGFGGYVISYIEIVSYPPFRLVAIFLGHLRMNMDEAIEALLDVALAIFPDSHPNLDVEARTKQLSESIESILQTRGVPVDRKMQEKGEEPVGCKVYV